LIGIGLIVAGVIYDVAVAQNIEIQAYPARVLEVSGITVAFSAIFGVAGWGFYRRKREEADEAAGRTPPEL
jgi:hypothetical protein